MQIWAMVGLGVLLVQAASAKNEALPPFEATTQCMLGVLTSEPHVRDGRFVGTSWARSAVLDANGEADTRPYFQYVFDDSIRGAVTVRFHRVDTHGPLWFQVRISGLATPGTSPLDYGTFHIATRWTNECHVAATVLYI